METLRKELTELGFDWNTGKIILWNLDGEYRSWSESQPVVKTIKDWKDKDLDYEYDTGYGSADTPHFIAEDDKFIYMPVQYDGASWLYKVSKDIDYYMTNEPPYEGGG
jgi:hypothetical protein